MPTRENIRLSSRAPLSFFFLPICFRICLGAQKNRLSETVLLSAHNICCG